MDAELVIRGGTVVDGTGSAAFAGDVAVAGGRIVGTGRGLSGARELDASGCVVAPGFVDIHTHYDAQVFWDPALTPSPWHGVTTVVAGNCGFSIAPLRAAHRELMIETLQNVEDMIPATLRAGVDWDSFETFGDYLDAVERRGVRLNFGAYVGHTAVRLWVLGDEAGDRAASPEEIGAMRRVVADALASGALGFASSSSPSHQGAGGRPVASRLGDLDELLSLVEPLRDARRGVIALLPGERVTIPDVFVVQRHSGRPLTWTPMLVMAGFPHEEHLQSNHAARRAGQAVWAQTAVRPIVFDERLDRPFVLNRLPSFARLSGASPSERAVAFGDEGWRAGLRLELESRPMDWGSISVSACGRRPEVVGSTVLELAEAGATTPLDAMLDLALADDLGTRFSIPVANADPAEVAPLLQADGVLLGLGDAGAHVGQLCDACFPTELLGTWVRDRGVLSVEAAVHKLTGEPASFLGLADRGTITEGCAADLCVFDPTTVGPGRLHRVRDLPAAGERVVADSGTGIRHVLVNGHPIRVDGADIDPAARPGSVLRSSPDPDR